MADKGLSATTELSRLEANLRERAHAENVQLSGINNLIMVDICHAAIVEAASRLHPVVRDFYRKTEEVNEANGFVDISAFDIASVDVNDLELRDATQGIVTIIPHNIFNDQLDLYTTDELDNALFARVVKVDTGSGVELSLEVQRGENKDPAGDLTFTFISNPKKETDPTQFVDFPDRYMMVVEDLGYEMLIRRMEQMSPAPSKPSEVA